MKNMNYDDYDIKPCKCGEPGRSDQTCPYDADIHNDPDSVCNCCAKCTRNCCNDV